MSKRGEEELWGRRVGWPEKSLYIFGFISVSVRGVGVYVGVGEGGCVWACGVVV